MTNEKKQCLLKYLGYYTWLVDGVWGAISEQATKDFQVAEGLMPDGVFGNATLAQALDAVANGRFKAEDSTPAAPTAQPDTPTAAPAPDLSEAAKYLQADGYYHIPRGVDVQLSRNLWSHEVMCQGKGCCTESIISKRMVETYQAIRDDYGEPIEIATADGSGHRCQTHNREVGGASGSLHLTGAAFDLHCKNKAKLLPIVERHITDGEIGVYSWGIHAGVWNCGHVNRFTK